MPRLVLVFLLAFLVGAEAAVGQPKPSHPKPSHPIPSQAKADPPAVDPPAVDQAMATPLASRTARVEGLLIGA
ncbi:MAG: hypothetical protein AAF624_09195, partial [Bacteroidota bacterium]